MRTQRVKKRIFSGDVCEQEVYTLPARADIRTAAYKPRFANDEERAAHRLGISRRNHNRIFNTNFGPSSLYSTLTFDQENEAHDWRDCRQLRDLYIRRLRRACPDAVIFAYCGQGKSTHRWHIHMVTEGIPKELLREKWTFGSVSRIEHLREQNYYNGRDYGRDYTALANYLFDHWTPDQGRNRWFMTRNARRPEEERPTQVKAEYNEKRAPRAPRGYELVEAAGTPYGLYIYKYVRRHQEIHIRK